jgi:penicillin-binding protein 1A
MYLNRVYFGSAPMASRPPRGAISTRARATSPSAKPRLLAGLVKAPSRLSPARDPKAAEERAQLVLQAMRDQGKISAKEDSAMSRPQRQGRRYWTGSENYVADMVMEELPDLIGDVKEDIVVDSTIDLTLEKLAEQSITDVLDKAARSSTPRRGPRLDRRPAPSARWSAARTIRPASSTAPSRQAPAGLGLQAVRLCGRAGRA